jgi:hypothetical protein
MGKINFQQNCGGAIQCYQQTSQGQTEVDCEQYLQSFGLNVSVIQQERSKLQLYIVLFSVVAAILLLLFVIGLLVLMRQGPPVEVTTQRLTVYTQPQPQGPLI